MTESIICKNCGYMGEAMVMFPNTRPTNFCPKCGTSDVELVKRV